MEDCEQLPMSQPADPISRPSSTSTSVSTSLPHLPNIAALAASNQVPETPQLRATAAPQAHNQPGISHAATSGVGGNTLPTCQNCTTSTTPLWRRDEFGAVLCNACGLFLKLHGRPRPISLKTDVIKSRNRVKTMRPDLANKRRQQQQQSQGFQLHMDTNGSDMSTQNTAAAAHQAIQRVTHNSIHESHDGQNSPIPRSETSVYHPALSSFIDDDAYQTNLHATTGGDESSNVDRSLDDLQTHEQLMAHNSSLKTRVSELEVINELYRGRITQVEHQEAAERQRLEIASAEQSELRTSLDMAKEIESQLRTQLQESHRRESELKRRLDELELEVAQVKDSLGLVEPPERRAKKARLDQDMDHAYNTEAKDAMRSQCESNSQTGPGEMSQIETQPESQPEPETETQTEAQVQLHEDLEPAVQAEHEPDEQSGHGSKPADSDERECFG
ncbi:hypothetical protein CDD81_1255 [Ophiocordyceps australis]|uniref:GATA-type domain-containing protein n=1 Tax=Ophiocordyceps australis TaxID=1399860 RepID=A0A2C5YDW5_9HYPO|nr:hypothetical protein CDD81_1255 [Ophiocordyceps australis]